MDGAIPATEYSGRPQGDNVGSVLGKKAHLGEICRCGNLQPTRWYPIGYHQAACEACRRTRLNISLLQTQQNDPANKPVWLWRHACLSTRCHGKHSAETLNRVKTAEHEQPDSSDDRVSAGFAPYLYRRRTGIYEVPQNVRSSTRSWSFPDSRDAGPWSTRS